MAGRKKSDAFDTLGFEILKVEEGGKRKYGARCKLCDKALANTSQQRLAGHRRICQNQISHTSEAIDSEEVVFDSSCVFVGKRKVSACNSFQEDSVEESGSPQKLQGASSQKKSKKPRLVNPKLEENINKVITNQLGEFNQSLVNFFIGCNIPFSVVDSVHFKDFVTKLRPGYGAQLPDSKALSSTFLDKSYNNYLTNISRSIKRESVLIIDSWKNAADNNKTVIGMLHNADGSHAFLNAWQLDKDTRTDDIADIVTESIALAKELYNTIIYAVVSDNAASTLKNGQTDDIWHITSSSHTGNLLTKDILDPSIQKDVSSIVNELKHHNFEREIINEGGCDIVTVVGEWWCSYRDSYVSFIKNLNIIKKLIEESVHFQKMKDEIKFLILDDEFIETVNKEIEVLEPISILINETKSKSCSLADATNLWLGLTFPPKFYNKTVEERKDMFLNDYGLTAYYLHPVYNEDAETWLGPENMEKVHTFLVTNLSAEGMIQLHKFQEKQGIFSMFNEKKLENPIVFWSMAKGELATLALKLLRIPGSCTSIQGVYPEWSYVHSTSRNKLSFIRSKQLMHVYHYLKNIDKSSDEY